MNAREWIDAYAQALGTAAPSSQEFKLLLELAGEAAHSSERVAAPVACWVAARSGRDLSEAMAAARAITSDG